MSTLFLDQTSNDIGARKENDWHLRWCNISYIVWRLVPGILAHHQTGISNRQKYCNVIYHLVEVSKHESVCLIYSTCHELDTVYPKKYAHGFVVLCFVVVMQSFIMNSYEVVIHIHQGCFAGTGAIVRLPQCQWSKPDGYGIISQCITTTKHSKAKTVCIFLGMYCTCSCFVVFVVIWNWWLPVLYGCFTEEWAILLSLYSVFPIFRGHIYLKISWKTLTKQWYVLYVLSYFYEYFNLRASIRFWAQPYRRRFRRHYNKCRLIG